MKKSQSFGSSLLLPAAIAVALTWTNACLAAPQTDTESTPADETVAVDSATEDTAAEGEQQAQDDGSFIKKINESLKPIDETFKVVNEYIGSVIFFPVPVGPKAEPVEANDKEVPQILVDARKTVAAEKEDTGAAEEASGFLGFVKKLGNDFTAMPLAVIILLAGATFFTIRMNFINLRGFAHAIMVTAGKYDNPEDEGEVTHFQALTAALSATVGLGNIAGVAVAISLGGPGATFWMVLAGFIGMTSKFVECTLGQLYRETRPDGRVMGGAMYYLSKGLAEKGYGGIGKVFGIMFAILCVGGSFAGGNSFQVNQSMGAISVAVGSLEGYQWIYGLFMAAMVAVVIIGGIQRIAAAAEKIVPSMCGIYVLAALAILIMNSSAIPTAFGAIFAGAFTFKAGLGGFVGVLVQGLRRAAFSNEAGVGSAAIAHAAAKTDYPVREGLVALLGPFIDTVVICTMTALVLIVTDPLGDMNVQPVGSLIAAAGEGESFDQAAADNIVSYVRFKDGNEGAGMTALAMESQIPYFKYVLAVCCMLFAFSTMISWSYYGERCWAYLFGDNSSMSYRIIFVIFTFLGSIISATSVFEFGDLMIFGMAIPNIIGVVMLSGKVREHLDTYWAKLKSGEIKPVK